MDPPMSVAHPPDLELARLLQVPGDAVRLLWMTDYYDGLLTGVAEYAARRWVLYALTDEQYRSEAHWHTLFRQHVGSSDMDFTGVPPPALHGTPDPEAYFAAHSAQYRPPHLQLDQVLGWCDDYVVRP
jgi:hypothetical protein